MTLIDVHDDSLEERTIDFFYDDDEEPRMRLRCGDLIEEDDPKIDWYTVSPTPAIIDTVARFNQRLMWKREGVEPKPMPRDPETGLTLAGLLSEEAVKTAEGQLWRVCASINCLEQFVFNAEHYL